MTTHIRFRKILSLASALTLLATHPPGPGSGQGPGDSRSGDSSTGVPIAQPPGQDSGSSVPTQAQPDHCRNILAGPVQGCWVRPTLLSIFEASLVSGEGTIPKRVRIISVF